MDLYEQIAEMLKARRRNYTDFENVSDGTCEALASWIMDVVTAQPVEPKYIWVVRKNSDQTEGRGPMVDVALCDTKQKAYEYNYDVAGIMGIPRHHGGEIWRIKLGTYPIEQIMEWGFRKRWDDKWDYGWVDLRDKPNTEDPEYQTYLRLKEKFDPSAPKDD